MMKHLFYIKLDAAKRDSITFLKKPHAADKMGFTKSHDRFATQNTTINNLFENKCHNFFEPGAKLPAKTQN